MMSETTEIGYVRADSAAGPVYRGTLMFVDHGLVWIQDPSVRLLEDGGFSSLDLEEIALPLHRVHETWTKDEAAA